MPQPWFGAAAATMASTASDVRKRSLNHISDLDDGPRKRLQSDTPAGAEAEDDQDEQESENLWPNYKELETYRKEAIYRQLLDSRRKLSRAKQRLRLVEGDLSRAEGTSAHLKSFWDLLVENVSSRIPAAKRGQLSALDPQAGVEPLQQVLKDQLAIITSLISVEAAAAGRANPEVSELQQRCDHLAQEAATCKQDLFLAQSKLSRSEQALRESSAKLSKVEKDFVRSQSEVVRVTEGRKSPTGEEAPRPAPTPTAGSSEPTSEKPNPSGRSSPAQPDAQAIVELRDQLARAQDSLLVAEKESDARYVEIQELNDEIKSFRLTVHQLRSQANDIPEERFEASSACKELRIKLAQVHSELRDAQDRLAGLEGENAALREEHAALSKSNEAELNERIEALEKTVKGRDSDVTRLRRQRDDLSAELTERRQREQVKFTQIEEMKALVNLKEERLAVLTSYVRRLRIAVAASRGEHAAVEALSAEPLEADQLDKLANAAKVAENEAKELRRKLSELSGKMEANGVAGVSSSQTTEQLEAEVKRLKLELQAAHDASTALCDEIDRLSIAHSDLEKKVSTQVLDLTKIENRTLRLVTEKSKADQKFFATMRVKESLEAENRTALRNVERQTKLIEVLADKEKTFAGQLKTHEKEVTLFKQVMEQHAKKIFGLEAELESSKVRVAEAISSKAEADESAKKLIDAASDEKDARKRTEEKVARLEKDLEQAQRQAARAAAAAGAKSGRKGTDADLETNAAAKKMLQCSTCKDGWRSRIITKCFHTFCKECIESRIATRQRKCPHCAVPFAVSDVQTLYLQ